jgi:hypothetical protein
MEGMRRFLLLLLVLAPSAALAAASSAVVVKADAGVRVGREPDWRIAAPGMEVEPVDLLEVPEGAKVTVRLPNGSLVEILGQTLLSGRRLLTDKSAAGRSVFFNKAFQDASSTLVVEVEDTGSTALAARGAQVGEEETRLGGGGRRAVAFLGDEEGKVSTRSNSADFAESFLRRGDWQLAADAAWGAIVSSDSTPLERRRGHLVMARIASNDGKQELALRDLDAACRAAGIESGGKPYVAAALVQRGQAWIALGDDGQAMSDFRAALDFDAEGAAGAQANFFLGALALSQQDVDTARSLFGRLKAYPELVSASAELLAASQP